MSATNIEDTLISLRINYLKEFKFLPDRRFRFDFYLPDYRTGIEYDGMFSHKSRHLTVTGFTRDCTKTNLAQLAGYRILRYTALNVSEIENDLKNLQRSEKKS